jgi:mono/diheme cytochrome c family protein
MPALWQQPIGAALALTLLTAARPAAADEDARGRGEYLVRAGGCFSCHTAAGGQPLAGGRALATPFGTFYSPNITPDPDTGIGRWTDAQFLRALREGVRSDGANYFPVFPYPSFTGITDSDALAIKAYLFSVPAVRQDNRPHDVAFPFSRRVLQTGWKLLFFTRARSSWLQSGAPLIIGAHTSLRRSRIAASATPRAISSAPRDPVRGCQERRMARMDSSSPTSRRIRAPGSASGKRATLSSS